MTGTALGAPAAAARLLIDALAAHGKAVRMSVPRGTLPILAATDPGVAQRVDAGDDWDWFLTDAPPPVQPGAQDVVLVRDDDAVATCWPAPARGPASRQVRRPSTAGSACPTKRPGWWPSRRTPLWNRRFPTLRR